MIKISVCRFEEIAKEMIAKRLRRQSFNTEVLNFCEEHLVNFTDITNSSFATFVGGISNSNFSNSNYSQIKIIFKGIRNWPDIKDDMLTFLTCIDDYYPMVDMQFQLISWEFNPIFGEMSSKNSRKTCSVKDVINDNFFLNEEVSAIHLNFKD